MLQGDTLSLKNAGATYQRTMTVLFHDMMYKETEVYVDYMIAKSKVEEDHLEDYKRFQMLQKYDLKLNSNKCVISATSGKSLGFIVSRQRM